MGGKNMQKIEKDIGEELSEDNLGFFLWHLQEIEHFYPCYKTMIRKKE